MNEQTAVTSTALKEGIGILYDMELNNYMMNRAISELDYKINFLGRQRNIPAPQKNRRLFDMIEFDEIRGCSLGGGFAGFVIFLFLDCFNVLKNLNNYGMTIAFLGFIAAGIIVVNASYFLFLVYDVYDNKKIYNAKYAEYLEKINNDKKRVANENLQKDKIISKKAALIKRSREAVEKLNRFYNAIGIDSHYRNIVPII